jgi:hypothetical protein
MKRAVALLLPALLLVGCAPTTDDAYLSTVRENVPALAEAADEELTKVGHQVCGMFEDRGFEDGMVEFIRVAKESGLSASEAGAVAGAASAAYCPDHADNF